MYSTYTDSSFETIAKKLLWGETPGTHTRVAFLPFCVHRNWTTQLLNLKFSSTNGCSLEKSFRERIGILFDTTAMSVLRTSIWQKHDLLYAICCKNRHAVCVKWYSNAYSEWFLNGTPVIIVFVKIPPFQFVRKFGRLQNYNLQLKQQTDFHALAIRFNHNPMLIIRTNGNARR